MAGRRAVLSVRADMAAVVRREELVALRRAESRGRSRTFGAWDSVFFGRAMLWRMRRRSRRLLETEAAAKQKSFVAQDLF
jgi:hypothetical protein